MQDDAPLMLLDVTPFNLGVRTAGGYTQFIIPRNSTVPTEATHVFTTVTDNQSSVRIQVVQGNSKIAEENQLLGEFALSDIPAANAGVPQIEVTFSIDANGILEVSARDLMSQKEQSIVVQASSYLSKEELLELKEASSSGEIKDRQASS